MLPTIEEIAEAQAAVNHTEESGLWFTDEPGEPTAGELGNGSDTAVPDFDPFPHRPQPDWVQDRERRKPRRKKKLSERVFNKDLDRDMARGTYARPVAKHPTNAMELTNQQIFRLFDARIHYGHPADTCYSMYRLKPTEDDRDHIEFVCWLNIREWMTSLRLCVYADLPETEWRAAESCTIAEKNLMDFLAVFRAKFAVKDPVRGRFYALCGDPARDSRSLKLKAAWEAVRKQMDDERRALLTRLKCPPAFIEQQMAFAARLEERNRKGSCGGMEV